MDRIICMWLQEFLNVMNFLSNTVYLMLFYGFKYLYFASPTYFLEKKPNSLVWLAFAHIWNVPPSIADYYVKNLVTFFTTCTDSVKCEEKLYQKFFQKNVEWKRKELENKGSSGTLLLIVKHIHGSFDGLLMQIYYWSLQLAVKCSQKNK